jgi:ferrochelatase
MRLVNALALTYGELINKPFISSFTNITFDAKKVKRGDLFIAFDVAEIEEAIFNGAYGIVFDKPTQISDTEIAWIKVKQSSDALIRLLRFRLIEKEVVSYALNELEFHLAKQIESDTSLVCVDGDIKSLWKSLWEIEAKTKVLYCPTLCNDEIFTDVKELIREESSHLKLVEKTLFESSFVYDDLFYSNQQLPALFLPYLENILSLYKEEKVRFRMKKFYFIENFKPQFVNKHLECKDFGESESVLIFEPNESFFQEEISYLKENSSWAQTFFFLPKIYSKKYEKQTNIFFYTDKKEIIKKLQKLHFHFALILGAKSEDIVQKPKRQTQLLLDF